MRPQDIVILLKIISIGNKIWRYRDLSASLQISISEISESISRSEQAGLILNKKVFENSLMDVKYGTEKVLKQ